MCLSAKSEENSRGEVGALLVTVSEPMWGVLPGERHCHPHTRVGDTMIHTVHYYDFYHTFSRECPKQEIELNYCLYSISYILYFTNYIIFL